MNAFFVAHVSIKSAEKFQEYSQRAGKTIADHNGEIVIRGNNPDVLAGQSQYSIVAMVKFPDRKTMDNWFSSSEYQGLIPLRDEAANMQLVAYDALG